MGLIGESFKYAIKQSFFNLFALLTFIDDVILGLVVSELMFNISQGTTTLISYVIGLKFGSHLLGLVLTRLTNNISFNIELKFREDGYHKYDKLSHTSKNNATSTMFLEKLNKATYPMSNIINWGLPMSCGLFGTFVSCIWTFFRMGLFLELIMIAFVSIIIYYFVIRSEQNIYTKLHKKLRDISDEFREKRTLALPGFQYNERTPKEMIEIDRVINDNDFKIQSQWTKIMTYSTLMNEISVVIISFITMTDYKRFMLVVLTLGSLSSAIRNLNQFVNQYNRLTNDYDSYATFWKGLEFINKPEQFPLPKTLEVTNVCVNKGDFRVTFDHSLHTLSFGKGTKTLIKGPTGHGKSTFIDGLTGKIPGVALNYLKPENYYSSMAEMYQRIRELTPSMNITLRDLFHGDRDDNLIMHCLALCFEEDELPKLLKALEDKDKDTNPSKEFDIEAQTISKKHALDCKLKEILSGGQKSRLCLATRVYDMKKNKKDMLILDEPEQGSDPKTAVKVLNRICNEFDTYVLVTHMCNCQLSQIRVDWTNQLLVENGIIYGNKFV